MSWQIGIPVALGILLLIAKGFDIVLGWYIEARNEMDEEKGR